MTKSAIRKAAYRLVVKQGSSHQEAFDELKEQNRGNWQTLADEVARFPSQARQKQNDAWRYSFVGILSLVIVLRLIAVASLLEMLNQAGPVFLLFMLIGVVVPALGIFGALTSRVQLYFVCASLMAVGLFRWLTNVHFSMSPVDWLMTLPQVAVIILGFYIPTRLRTPYQKKVVIRQSERGEVKELSYVFGEEPKAIYSDEVLDQGI